VPQLGEARNEIFQVAVEAGVDAKIVVAGVREIQAHGKLVDAGFAQREVFLLRHQGPVRYQNGVRELGTVLDGADNFHHIFAHQRLAARHLDYARPQRLHVAAVIGGLQVAGFVARSAVIAMLAPAGARVGDFE